MHKFRTRIALTALAASALAISGCKPEVEVVGPQPVSQEEAAKVMDAAQSAWSSSDVGKIDAVYAGDIVTFDVETPGRIEGSDAMRKVNEGFAKMKFDAVTTADRKIQVLGPDAFVASGIAHFTSTTGEVKASDIRYTEVFQKQSDGSWKIVHEHISFPPKPAQ